MFRFAILMMVCCWSSMALANGRLVVFAAASQRDVLEHLGRQYEQTCNCEVVFSFASTGVLARQIDVGANAQVFVSANEAWVDWLQERGVLEIDSGQLIAGNRLVIAAAAKTKDSFNILMRERFAMANPVSVPAGIYAVQALKKMGIWEKVKANAVYAENVRLALYSVRRGDLLSGIVYQSDLQQVPELHAHFTFPSDSHDPVRYIAATVEPTKLALGFVSFLKSTNGQKAFEQFGFLPISATK